jgi:hypothetical protein
MESPARVFVSHDSSRERHESRVKGIAGIWSLIISGDTMRLKEN